MRLAPARDLKAAVVAADGRVLIKLGSLRFTCTRGEAIAFAAEIVRAVDELRYETPGLA